MSVRTVRRRTKLTTLGLIFASVMMVAQAARMLYQGVYYPNAVYRSPAPHTLDFWFDWFLMLMLGISIGILGWKRWVDRAHGDTISYQCSNCGCIFSHHITTDELHCPNCNIRGTVDMSQYPYNLYQSDREYERTRTESS